VEKGWVFWDAGWLVVGKKGEVGGGLDRLLVDGLGREGEWVGWGGEGEWVDEGDREIGRWVDGSELVSLAGLCCVKIWHWWRMWREGGEWERGGRGKGRDEAWYDMLG
jgi:hypothetical protein